MDIKYYSDEQMWMRRSFRRIDQLFREFEDQGASAIVAHLDHHQKKLVVANAGTARCLISRKGKFQKLYLNHNPSDPNEKKRIENAGLKVIEGKVDGKIGISRALGFHSFKKNFALQNKEQAITSNPSCFELSLDKKPDFILLGSFGVFDRFDDDYVS